MKVLKSTFKCYNKESISTGKNSPLRGLLPKLETGAFHAEELYKRVVFLLFILLDQVCKKYTQAFFFKKAKSSCESHFNLGCVHCPDWESFWTIDPKNSNCSLSFIDSIGRWTEGFWPSNQIQNKRTLKFSSYFYKKSKKHWNYYWIRAVLFGTPF